MTWEHPLILGLAPLLMVAAWWTFHRAASERRPSLAQVRRLWADDEGLHDTPRARRRRGRGVLLAAASLLACLALARPQWGTIEQTTYERSREVLLALDLSRSMLAGDVSPTRLERAKLLVDALLDQLRGERVGLVVFAGTAFLQSPMSAEYDVLRDFLRDLDPTYLPQGGTNYTAMLQTAIRAFGEEANGDRFLVVLSDGEAHDDEWKNLAPSLQQKGIRVISLGVGTPEGGLVPDGSGGVEKDEQGAAVLSRLEPETLRELSARTGGTYRDAAVWVDVAELVGATVEQGTAGRFVETKASRLRDRYQWLLAPALLLFLLSYWLDFPVLPVPRTLQRRQGGFAPVRNAAAAAALLLAVGGTRGSAAVAPDPAAALEQTVAALAAKPELAPQDLAELARTTIDYASQPDAEKRDERLAVLDDALRGVDEGERMDGAAADWPELRRQLEALKQAEEEQQQAGDEQREQEQNQEQDGSGDENGKSAGAGEAGEPGDAGESGDDSGKEPADAAGQAANSEAGDGSGSRASGEKEREDVQSGASRRSPDDGASPPDGATPPDGEKNTADGEGDAAQGGSVAGAGAEEPQPLDDDGARLGELNAAAGDPRPEAETPETPAQPSRMVGGGAAAQSNGGEPRDLALAGIVDRMERVEEGDSPATLFERMNRAEGAPATTHSGKNW